MVGGVSSAFRHFAGPTAPTGGISQSTLSMLTAFRAEPTQPSVGRVQRDITKGKSAHRAAVGGSKQL
eukprot:861850-Alexandrium_andersonii.AAC.1